MPSTRSPLGDTIVRVRQGGSSITWTGRSGQAPSARGFVQRFSVLAVTPSSRASSHHQSPRARRYVRIGLAGLRGGVVRREGRYALDHASVPL
jgi:hypothetical protein